MTLHKYYYRNFHMIKNEKKKKHTYLSFEWRKISRLIKLNNKLYLHSYVLFYMSKYEYMNL